MFSTASLAVALLASGIAQAGPVPIPIPIPQDSNPTPSWTTGNPGNLTMSFTDGTMNWGDQAPATVLGQLYDKCSEVTGVCDPNPFSVQANAPASGGGINPFTINLNIQESFYPIWAHNGLIDALIAAANTAQVNNPVTYSPNTICTSGPDCIYQEPETIDQWQFPTAIELAYQSPDSDAAPIAVIAIGVSESSDSDGFCSTFTTIGSAVAGAVNGVAGGIFSLIGLACE